MLKLPANTNSYRPCPAVPQLLPLHPSHPVRGGLDTQISTQVNWGPPSSPLTPESLSSVVSWQTRQALLAFFTVRPHRSLRPRLANLAFRPVSAILTRVTRGALRPRQAVSCSLTVDPVEAVAAGPSRLALLSRSSRGSNVALGSVNSRWARLARVSCRITVLTQLSGLITVSDVYLDK